MCFSMDFLNTKIIFLHLGFYNMFVNSKGCWPIFQKYKNLIFGNSSLFTINVWLKNPIGANIQNITRNNLLLFTINVWIKKSQWGKYPKYY